IVPLQYLFFSSFFFNDPLPPEIYTLSLHDALPISELNAKHWSWLSVEYHARQHSTTGRVPREHWLAELPFLRTLPRQKNFGDVFLHRERRVVRKDGTVRFRGGYWEVRSELVAQEVELRFDP